MAEDESLLTTLCAICHIQPPKYRCPRCLTRTCSLPCTRRHKLWSQCTGIRDPAAYLRRTDLATESAFDHDFNFISGIERRIERAGREAENRGVDLDARNRVRDPGVVGLEHEQPPQDERGWKRKRNPGAPAGAGPGGLPKGEAGFLKRMQEAGVTVIRAPKGMSRAKMNGSRWHPRQKCLQWTVEWVTDDGTKRLNCAETITVAEAYDRAFPLTKEEKLLRSEEVSQESQKAAQGSEKPAELTQSDQAVPETAPQSSTTEPLRNEPTPAQENTAPEPTEQTIAPHRNIFFYIHRPRTATKQPVLCPVAADITLANALRDRVVVEFPTIYVLRCPLDDSQPEESKYILEKEYLRTHPNAEPEDEGPEDTDAQPLFGAVNIPDVDEGKILEVLTKDILGAAPGAGESL